MGGASQEVVLTQLAIVLPRDAHRNAVYTVIWDGGIHFTSYVYPLLYVSFQCCQ